MIRQLPRSFKVFFARMGKKTVRFAEAGRPAAGDARFSPGGSKKS